ncbi:MAG: methionyl-tRNA formyltransferase, partial [Polyangiaceae bacterium]
PDKPKGRGLAEVAPPVKERALALGLPVVQPTKLRTGEFGAWVRERNADVALVVAYGRILPRDVLDGTRVGCVNVHASLLPKYRGAAPITWAVVNGESESGVTLMLLDEGMDTGDTLAFFPTPVGPDETAGELSERLALLGAKAVTDTLPAILRGEFTRTKQDDTKSSLAPMLEKAAGAVDWTKSAKAVHDHVRGMSPWPGAFTRSRGKMLKVLRTRPLAMEMRGTAADAKPGTVLVADKTRVVVRTGTGAVELDTVQLEGKKPVRASEWVNGRGVAEGDVLGESA